MLPWILSHGLLSHHQYSNSQPPDDRVNFFFGCTTQEPSFFLIPDDPWKTIEFYSKSACRTIMAFNILQVNVNSLCQTLNANSHRFAWLFRPSEQQEKGKPTAFALSTCPLGPEPAPHLALPWISHGVGN